MEILHLIKHLLNVMIFQKMFLRMFIEQDGDPLGKHECSPEFLPVQFTTWHCTGTILKQLVGGNTLTHPGEPSCWQNGSLMACSLDYNEKSMF